MDIFNRKKLAAAEAEIIRLKEENHKQYNELEAISDRIQIAENNAKKYKQQVDENNATINQLKQENDKLNSSISDLNYCIKISESKYAAHENWNSQRNIEFNNANNKIEELEKKLEEAEALNLNLILSLEQLQGRESIEDTNNRDRTAYQIRDEIVRGRKDKKNIPNDKPDEWESGGRSYEQVSTSFMSALYKSKKIYNKNRVEYFFSANEFNFFELLMPFIQSNELVLLSKVRLVDIIELWEKFYNNEAKETEKKQNPREDGGVFLNALEKNDSKRQINERIIELNPNFNNTDYKTAFLYPLFRLHVDFLICKRTNADILPILAVELNGKEHYQNYKSYDSYRVNNDELKQAIFRSKAVNVGFLTIYNDLLYEKRDELMKIMSDTLSRVSDGYNKVNWNDTQNSLSELAKPYIEKLGK